MYIKLPTCLSFLGFFFFLFLRLIKNVEVSQENALTSSEIIKRMDENIHSVTLGKQIKKLFKHVEVKRVRAKDDRTKKENIYHGIFWKAVVTENVQFSDIPCHFPSEFFLLRIAVPKEVTKMGYMI